MNLTLILGLFIPLIITVVFFFGYLTLKMRENAIEHLKSDGKVAELIYQNAVHETEHTAGAYARKKTVVFFFNLSLGSKVGNDLAKSASHDLADMVTIVDTEYKVRARSHAPEKTDDTLSRKEYIHEAFSGKSLSSTEVLTKAELSQEHFDTENMESDKVLAITGIAPIFDRKKEAVIGALIVRRILNNRPEIVGKMSDTLKASAGLFRDTDLIAYKTADGISGMFPLPRAEQLDSVLEQNTSLHTAETSTGRMSAYLPVRDFSGKAAGIIMITRDAEDYIRAFHTCVAVLSVILTLGIVVLFVFRMFLERKIIAPLKYLCEKTETITLDKDSELAEITADDEIGHLAAAFNRMTDRLRASHRALADEVNRRRHAEKRLRNMHQKVLNAQESERRQIALDLHDDIIQNLAGAKLEYEIVLKYGEHISDEMKEKSEWASSIVEGTIRSLRKMVHELRPATLERLGLGSSVRGLCDNFREKTGVPVDFLSTGMEQVSLDYEISINIYRIVQEALNNIRKYAAADQVFVRLLLLHPNIILKIYDDGRGFDVNKVPNNVSDEHIGIGGMRERARLINGNMKIESYPGKGTKLFMEIRVDKEAWYENGSDY